MENNMDYKDRTVALKIIGALLLLVGSLAAFYGPLEFYPFYLFSEGGRFYYEGFSFGSFMFGNIAVQVAGYYFIALILLPLGYGHLRVRRWARPFALTLLWTWLILGVPLLVVFALMLFSVKDLPLFAVVLVFIFLVLSYLAFPWLFIRFYQGDNARRTFEAKDSQASWIETRPLPVLVLCTLFVFYLIALHVPVFFNGIFPFFGLWLSGLTGFFLLDLAILSLGILTWGVFQQRVWAWWGALFYLVVMILATTLTLLGSSYMELLTVMNFPPYEMDILSGVPVQSWHLAAFIGLPLLATLVVLLRSKRYF